MRAAGQVLTGDADPLSELGHPGNGVMFAAPDYIRRDFEIQGVGIRVSPSQWQRYVWDCDDSRCRFGHGISFVSGRE
jgi:hypothetical protein